MKKRKCFIIAFVVIHFCAFQTHLSSDPATPCHFLQFAWGTYRQFTCASNKYPIRLREVLIFSRIYTKFCGTNLFLVGRNQRKLG